MSPPSPNKKAPGGIGFPPAGKIAQECCSVESVVTVDERGQMILPKEIRDKAGIRPGDKLVLVSMKQDDRFCCLLLIRAEAFEELVPGLLSPLRATRGKSGATE